MTIVLEFRIINLYTALRTSAVLGGSALCSTFGGTLGGPRVVGPSDATNAQERLPIAVRVQRAGHPQKFKVGTFVWRSCLKYALPLHFIGRNVYRQVVGTGRVGLGIIESCVMAASHVAASRFYWRRTRQIRAREKGRGRALVSARMLQ
jgi:hypothetical protein